MNMGFHIFFKLLGENENKGGGGKMKKGEGKKGKLHKQWVKIAYFFGFKLCKFLI